DSDETGIVVAGESDGGHGYVLADYSMRGTPDEVMKKAAWAYHFHQADRVVAEANNGGDYLGTVLQYVDPNVPYGVVRASRGKAIRAEPVSALAEQHRLHHVGCFPELEDQLCAFVPDLATGHDDRMDALVWAVSELRGLSAGSYLEAYGMVRCTACEEVFQEALAACPKCHAAAPQRASRPVPEREDAPDGPQPLGGWALAYGAVKCPAAGHVYIARTHPDGCPRCAGGGMGQRGGFAFPSLPQIMGRR